MTQLSIVGNAAKTMTSREIAELTGKDLSHIHRDTRAMLDELAGTDDPDLDHVREDKDARGYTTCFHLPKSLTITLMAGYSVKMRHAIVKRWQELEAEKAGPTLDTEEGKLLVIQEMAAKQLALIHENRQIAIERDHAVKTKAQIGDKRQATSMAKVAIANREVAKLKDQLGFSARHATILQVEDALGGDFDFVPLRRWCKAHEVTPQTVPDKRYPKGVKAWPADAWGAVYGVDLVELFGEVAA